MAPRPRRPDLRTCGLLLLLLLAARIPLARGVAPLEGTFVGARLAAHAAAGAGPVFNPALGDPQLAHPVESPLRLALVTRAALVGLPPLGAALGLALAAELAAALLLLALLAERPRAAGAAVVLLAATPALGHVTAGGGVGPLALLCVLAACACARARSGVVTGLFAGLAAAAAPEAALVLPGIWLARRGEPARMLPEALAFLAVVAVAAWTLVRITGDWRPAPLLVDAPRWGPALPNVGAAAPLLLTGLLLVRRGSGIGPVGPLLVVAGVAALPWLVLGPSLDGRAAYLSLAGLAVAAGVGFDGLLMRTNGWVRAVAAATVVALGAITLPRADADLHARIWEPLAAWAEENEAGGAYMLASEPGFAGWYTEAVVQGCNPDPQGLVAQLVTLQPKYLLLRAERDPGAALRSHGDLARAWYPIERFSVDGATALEPELAALPERAAGDYLLFLRRL